MFKIEFQYRDDKRNVWRKSKHKLYETEKAYKTYWAFHKKDQEYFARLSGYSRRMVGYQDGVQIDVKEWK